jgi:membrane protease YdiL (CAAX protease family)
MELNNAFLNQAGRLRSGWRLAVFVALFVVLFLFSTAAVFLIFRRLPQTTSFHYLENLVFRVFFLGSAILPGWLCNYWIEGLPWRALGITLHRGWWRDLLIGSLIGIVSLSLTVLAAFGTGGLRLGFSPEAGGFPIVRALGGAAVLFMIAALAEEAAFRGYPMQTLTRAGLAGLGLLLTSVPFASAHLQNPNVAAGFTFINTSLAGVWLGVAYLRTRSLWFPLGVHWAWNFAQGSIFGGPVSGMTVTNHPVLQSFDKGPAWLTGGTYGLEGGLCCTIVLVLSTLFIWRTRLVSATDDLKLLTSQENPVRPDVRQT